MILTQYHSPVQGDGTGLKSRFSWKIGWKIEAPCDLQCSTLIYGQSKVVVLPSALPTAFQEKENHLRFNECFVILSNQKSGNKHSVSVHSGKKALFRSHYQLY